MLPLPTVFLAPFLEGFDFVAVEDAVVVGIKFGENLRLDLGMLVEPLVDVPMLVLVLSGCRAGRRCDRRRRWRDGGRGILRAEAEWRGDEAERDAGDECDGSFHKSEVLPTAVVKAWWAMAMRCYRHPDYDDGGGGDDDGTGHHPVDLLQVKAKARNPREAPQGRPKEELRPEA